MSFSLASLTPVHAHTDSPVPGTGTDQTQLLWDTRAPHRLGSAKNSLGRTRSVADPIGTDNPEMLGSTLISCQEGGGGPAKFRLNYRHVPSSVAVTPLLGRQDKAGPGLPVVVESSCGCSCRDKCDDRWKRGERVFQIYSSLSITLFFSISEFYPFIFQLESVQN